MVWLRMKFFSFFCAFIFIVECAPKNLPDFLFSDHTVYYNSPTDGKLLLIDSKLHLILLGSIFIERACVVMASTGV